MRTTLTIADDVLLAARDRAARTGSTIGRVISDLARQALCGSGAAEGVLPAGEIRNGFPLLPRRPDVVVTMELVNRLRDQEDG